jgi:hypothetical protein
MRYSAAIAALLIGLGGAATRASAQTQSLAAGPTVTQVVLSIPPQAAGLARVWFLRQYQPSEGLGMPTMFVNGAPLASSVPGTALYRDFPPGAYTFSVETCTIDFGQDTVLKLLPGMQTVLEVQSLSSFRAPNCPRNTTFYMRPISPERAQLYYPQLTYLGAR